MGGNSFKILDSIHLMGIPNVNSMSNQRTPYFEKNLRNFGLQKKVVQSVSHV